MPFSSSPFLELPATAGKVESTASLTRGAQGLCLGPLILWLHLEALLSSRPGSAGSGPAPSPISRGVLYFISPAADLHSHAPSVCRDPATLLANNESKGSFMSSRTRAKRNEALLCAVHVKFDIKHIMGGQLGGGVPPP